MMLLENVAMSGNSQHIDFVNILLRLLDLRLEDNMIVLIMRLLCNCLVEPHGQYDHTVFLSKKHEKNTILWNKVIDIATGANPNEVDGSVANVWMLIDTEELRQIFEIRKTELFNKYSTFKQNNGLFACLLKKLMNMDDQIIELSISKDLFGLIESELKVPTMILLVSTGILEAVMSSREIFLEQILSHEQLWKTIKKILTKKSISSTAPWLANAILKSCLVATKNQMIQLLSENVLSKALSILCNSADYSSKKFMQAADCALRKLLKLGGFDPNLDIQISECLNTQFIKM